MYWYQGELYRLFLCSQELFADSANGDFFVTVGRELFSTLLINAQRVSFFEVLNFFCRSKLATFFV
jgi:hypothetical protein